MTSRAIEGFALGLGTSCFLSSHRVYVLIDVGLRWEDGNPQGIEESIGLRPGGKIGQCIPDMGHQVFANWEDPTGSSPSKSGHGTW